MGSSNKQINKSDTPEEVIEKVLGIKEEDLIVETVPKPEPDPTPPKPIVRHGPDLSKEAHRDRLGLNK